jgi:hypothetical protein
VKTSIVEFTHVMDETCWFIDGVEHYFYKAHHYQVRSYEHHYISNPTRVGHHTHSGFRYVEGETLW